MPLSSDPQNPTPQKPAENASAGAAVSSADTSLPAPTYAPSKIWTICFAALTLEVGGFLLVFPWLEAWHLNHFPALVPVLFGIWDDPYFRGAISGLGVVNLLISFAQTLYLFRPSSKS